MCEGNICNNPLEKLYVLKSLAIHEKAFEVCPNTLGRNVPIGNNIAAAGGTLWWTRPKNCFEVTPILRCFTGYISSKDVEGDM
jgi:hypothetical protein